MDAERLEAAQICDARVRVGDVVGHVAGFRTGDESGHIRLRGESGQVHEFAVAVKVEEDVVDPDYGTTETVTRFDPGPASAVELVDDIDEEKVAQVREERSTKDREVVAKRRAHAALDAIEAGGPEAIARLRELLGL